MLNLKPRNGEAIGFLHDTANYKGDQCIPWPFTKKGGGRGWVLFRGKGMAASRAMCILVHGDPPFPKAEAAHSCGRGDKSCITPGHLSWKTRRQNEDDKIDHGTVRKGVDCNFVRMTPEQVLAIYADPRTQDLIAADQKCTQSAVSLIKSGARWAHVTGHAKKPRKRAA